MDDRDIIALFQQRNEAAVSEAAEKYAGYCRGIARRILQNPEDAEEAVNDTWLAAWNSIPPHDPACLKTYLGRLTRNISLNTVRARQTLKRGADGVSAAYEEMEELLASSQDVEADYAVQELTEAINAFLGRLSDTERIVFVRRYWYMQPIVQIASDFGFSENRTAVMLFRLRKKLYAKLKKEGFL